MFEKKTNMKPPTTQTGMEVRLRKLWKQLANDASKGCTAGIEDIEPFIRSEITTAIEAERAYQGKAKREWYMKGVREERERIREIVKGLYKHYGHKDHDDKDEWYACLKCMDDTNLDEVLSHLTTLTKEEE